MLNPEETLAQKFVKKGFWLYFFTFLIGPIGYMVKMTLSHDLSVSEVGIIYGILSFVGLLSAFNDLGCTESLNYFLPKYIIKKEYGKAKYLIQITFLLQLCSSISIAALMFFIAPWLARVYFGEPDIVALLRIAGVYFIGINLFHISTVFFSISQDTKLQKGVDLFRILITLIGALGLAFSHQGNTESYMYIWLVSTFLGCIVAMILAYNKYYKPYFSQSKSESIPAERNHFFRYAFATMLTANIGTILSQVDTQLIIFFLGSEANGYYSNYLSLLNIPFIFISPIIGFLFPVISELHGREDREKMRQVYKQFSLYFSIIGIWIGVFLFQFGDVLSVVFFGKKFLESGIILAYSSFFLVFNLLIQINFQFLAGTGKIGDRAKILLMVLPINIILNIVCIKYLDMGVRGSALAVGLSWIPLWYLSYRATRIHSGGLHWIPVFKNALIVGGSYIGLSFLFKNIPLSLDSRFEAIIVLCIAIVINLIIFVLGNFGMLREMWNIVRKNK